MSCLFVHNTAASSCNTTLADTGFVGQLTSVTVWAVALSTDRVATFMRAPEELMNPSLALASGPSNVSDLAGTLVASWQVWRLAIVSL